MVGFTAKTEVWLERSAGLAKVLARGCDTDAARGS